MYTPRLQWVSVRNAIRHVSEFANLETQERPHAYCPACGASVILKLGHERADHAAHHQGSLCPTIQPETAIHLNAKYYLQQSLSQCDNLTIWQKCSGWLAGQQHNSCRTGKTRSITYVQGWDRVDVEYSFGGYRIDVALSRAEQVIGAIEVLVTHPSEAGKIDFLNNRGLGWLEIKVTPDFYSPPTAWTPIKPLSVEKCNSALLAPWSCEHCQTLLEEHQQNIAMAKRQAEERQREIDFAKQFEPELVRLIDFYYPSGKLYRKLYLIQKRIIDGRIAYVDLHEVMDSRKIIAVEYPPITEQSYDRLRLALENKLKSEQRPGWLVDTSHSWDAVTAGFDLRKYRNSSRHAYNYEKVSGKWQKVSRSNKNRKALGG